ncbi:MAG: TonB-dependent receptor [Pseudomonadota bacterium]
MTPKALKHLLLMSAFAAGVPIPAAHAQVEEIIVTSQRREQGLQDIPLSVTALDDRQLRDTGLQNSLAIGDIVPNLEIKTFGGVPNIFIRGVGNNDFNSSSVSPISIYRDDVVVASTGSQIFALFDLERVEVLRGPQGTLFGKNTTGGAIQYVSKLPDGEFEGYARAGYGRFKLFEAEAGASIPLADAVSMRVSGITRRRDGERTNIFNGDDAINIDEAATRVILRYNPGSNLDIRLSAGTGRDRSDYLNPKPLGTVNGGNIFGYTDPEPDDISILNFNADSRNFSDNTWVALNVSVELTDQLTLRSISGYDTSDIDNRVDVDGSPLRVDEITFLTETEQFSQELQLLYSGDRFNGLLGLYFFDETLDARSEADLIGELSFADGAVPLITEAMRENQSYSVFGEVTYGVSDQMSVTGGLRYTWDDVSAEHRGFLIPGFFDDDIPNGAEIDLVPFGELADTFKAFSWRVVADYKITPDILTYASINRGFKSGTFNIGIITSLAERTQVEPEFLTAYELGLKSTLFDQRVRLNVSAFYYDYSDLQVLSVNQQGSGIPTLGLDNAADARIFGLEFELYAKPTEALDLGLNFGLLDAEFQNYTSGAIDPVSGQPRDFSGNRLPGAPSLTLSTFGQYTQPITNTINASLRLEYNYTGKKFYNNAEDDLVSSQEGYGLVNIRAAIREAEDEWEVAFWGRNITGEAYIIDATDLRDFGLIPLYYGERATWGVEAIFNF